MKTLLFLIISSSVLFSCTNISKTQQGATRDVARVEQIELPEKVQCSSMNENLSLIYFPDRYDLLIKVGDLPSSYTDKSIYSCVKNDERWAKGWMECINGTSTPTGLRLYINTELGCRVLTRREYVTYVLQVLR